MITTIPYTIQTNYKKISHSKPIPVFNAIPLEEDFEIATNKNTHQGFCCEPKVILDFEYFIVMISKGKDNKYYILHEFSLEELWCAYVILGECTWSQVVLLVKYALTKQAEELTCHLRKINRIIKSE